MQHPYVVPQIAKVRLDHEARRALARVMRRRDLTVSGALRLAVATFLQVEQEPGFGDAESRAGYQEGVSRGIAVIRMALLKAAHEATP